ncbi:MAG: polysaccharide deacetylase family protein [Deltaproteobacteria bacterium]|nr:polysaccharide deacetylase family protein [Myxococcales bacterium]MDP3214646.1 polysaccharide deacetylase family protein [Deltaproteobacteria bacterium]
MTLAYVLMYHRVCERTEDTACWFARGTAVTPEHFATQIGWLRSRVRFVPLDAAVEGVLSGGGSDQRPLCAVTFDDGYRDAQVAVDQGVPATVFAVAAHTGDARDALWFDRYYDILHSARRRASVQGALLELPADAVVPAIDDDLCWWVRGPVKEALQAMEPTARDERLRQISEVLDASSRTLPRDLYFSRDELGALMRSGHAVGGHGASHSRLTSLDDATLAAELAASRALVDGLGDQPARLFCYPDGAWDGRVQAAVRTAGFPIACAVTEGVVSVESPRLALPRILMRDVLPGERGWPAALEAP